MRFTTVNGHLNFSLRSIFVAIGMIGLVTLGWSQRTPGTLALSMIGLGASVSYICDKLTCARLWGALLGCLTAGLVGAPTFVTFMRRSLLLDTSSAHLTASHVFAELSSAIAAGAWLAAWLGLLGAGLYCAISAPFRPSLTGVQPSWRMRLMCGVIAVTLVAPLVAVGLAVHRHYAEWRLVYDLRDCPVRFEKRTMN
jgi:hypothetical protein